MIDRAPSFERVLTALRCEEPDYVPVAELWIDPAVKSTFMGHPVQTLQDEVAFWVAAGYDFIPLDSDLWATPQIQKSIVTPTTDTALVYASSERERDWVATEAGVITSWEDFERFPWPNADDIDYSQYDEVRLWLPTEMKVLATFGHIFTTTWQLMGFEHFCTSLYMEMDLVREIILRICNETMKIMDRVLSFSTVGAMCFQDDIAYTNGLMVSPDMLRELFFPLLSQIADVCHARGRPLIYHSDGKLDQVLPDIVKANIDAIQAIEPKCMDIVAIKREYGEQLALMGNLDLGYTLTRGAPEEVEVEVKRLIKYVAPGGGLLLGSTNSITNYVPLENFRAMLQAAFTYGKYPIEL